MHPVHIHRHVYTDDEIEFRPGDKAYDDGLGLIKGVSRMGDNKLHEYGVVRIDATKPELDDNRKQLIIEMEKRKLQEEIAAHEARLLRTRSQHDIPVGDRTRATHKPIPAKTRRQKFIEEKQYNGW